MYKIFGRYSKFVVIAVLAVVAFCIVAQLYISDLRASVVAYATTLTTDHDRLIHSYSSNIEPTATSSLELDELDDNETALSPSPTATADEMNIMFSPRPTTDLVPTSSMAQDVSATPTPEPPTGAIVVPASLDTDLTWLTNVTDP
jgi:hypothetical protein